jgi:serine/threonine-protein kinase
MPEPGDRIGHFLIERGLGRGGEAAVFEGRDLQTNQPVVLKILDPSTLGEVAAFERLRREIAIGRLLLHPGIPRLLEAHEDARPPFLVLEYTEGQALATIIKEAGPLPLARALTLAKGLVDVVAYCHQRQVYHRDLKPENILVDDRGQVKIIDFGIALLEGAARVTWRGFSGLVGTPEYMAPEQIRGERGGPETDVYALGLILYELLAGHPPYRAPNPLSTMYQHLNMTAPPLQDLRPDVPRNIAAIVAKAMRRRPAERYPNAEALFEALNHPESVDDTILDRPDPPLSPRGRESILSQPLVLTALVAVATAILVVVAEILLRR